MLALLFYSTPLIIPPLYFLFTRGGRRRFTKEMWIGFVLQLFWTAAVYFVVLHYWRSGNPDLFYSWFYLVPVNLFGIFYFATIPFWTAIYKK